LDHTDDAWDEDEDDEETETEEEDGSEA